MVSFVFTRITIFPEAKLRGTPRLRGCKIHCFPCSQLLSVLFVILPNSKVENTAKKLIFQHQLAQHICPIFKAQDLIMFESDVQVVGFCLPQKISEF